ncbi:GIY-YIG nuclease family protein [Candidatus Peregrinibacteria bacterium]|jgi:putative endonuclease|nr:GIY-YIG nuclease family protein [Candidatus Peregrinibacteria bacterium]MBT4147944.1 GIY-YIG nuclease family protein [Candidatus Peregrinibacteria bacterium]MBT4366530.1 GIY-YIG nuclease family protein [Candidatus Peregrinibacteria bacterium]MBT4456164.1 GIY-YIG nuclease family protein [Candidatus Peregrinibacteria bacterium]
MSKFYTYLARCNDGSLYTGYTVDLNEREAKHNEGKGARYTRVRLPVKIVYSEEFQTKSEAMKREYEIKCLSKKEKEGLVSGKIHCGGC